MLEFALPLIEDAVSGGAIPGAGLGVVDLSGKREIQVRGAARLSPERADLSPDALFDLASLTKVILTTPVIMRLVETGRVGLDDPLVRHIPDLHQYDRRHWVCGLTIRACLSHATPLPAVAPLYTWSRDEDQIEARVLQEDWPRGEPVYSDINFILLGILIQRVVGKPLASLVPDGFVVNPGPGNVAATEYCRWRNRLLEGETHDENAFAMGGLAGHAGLFGSIDAVLSFAAALMRGEILGPAALAAMAERQSATRALGWMAKHADWSGGELCSAATVGHTGFTGTGLWIDFERGYAWALLTNRVHPSRHAETGIRELRQRVGNAIAGAWRPARGG